MKYASYFFLIMVVCCSSCQKEIEVKFPFEETRFLLFGVLESDQIIQVKVDKTYPPNGEVLFSDSFLDSTVVSLYEDGIFVETLTQSPSNKHIFQSKKSRAKVGRSYEIKVENPHIPQATSRLETLLEGIKIDSVWFDPKAVLSPINPRIPTKMIHVSLSGIPPDVPVVFFEFNGFKNKELGGIPMGRDRIGGNIISTEEYDELENPCKPYAAGIFFKTSCYKRDHVVFSFYAELEGTIQNSNQHGRAEVEYFEIKVSSVNDSFLEFHKNTNQTLDFFSIMDGIKPTNTAIINGYGAVLTKNASVVNLRYRK